MRNDVVRNDLQLRNATMHVGSRWSVSRGNEGRIQSERYTRYRSVYTHSTHPLTDHALLDATASTPIPLERDLSRTHQSFGYISWLSRLIFQSRFSVCFSYFVIIKRLNRCASLSFFSFHQMRRSKNRYIFWMKQFWVIKLLFDLDSVIYSYQLISYFFEPWTAIYGRHFSVIFLA